MSFRDYMITTLKICDKYGNNLFLVNTSNVTTLRNSDLKSYHPQC